MTVILVLSSIAILLGGSALLMAPRDFRNAAAASPPTTALIRRLEFSRAAFVASLWWDPYRLEVPSRNILLRGHSEGLSAPITR